MFYEYVLCTLLYIWLCVCVYWKDLEAAVLKHCTVVFSSGAFKRIEKKKTNRHEIMYAKLTVLLHGWSRQTINKDHISSLAHEAFLSLHIFACLNPITKETIQDSRQTTTFSYTNFISGYCSWISYHRLAMAPCIHCRLAAPKPPSPL